ncbi:MAG: peptide deformylase [Microscillaceae bacterium]
MGTIYEGTSTAAMRVLKITHYADSVFLRGKAQPVKPDPQDTVLRYFLQRLYQTVRHPRSAGIGIAAPQVGIPRQIIWVQRLDKPEEDYPFEAYLNPVIEAYSDSAAFNREGCLSIPNRFESVKRPCSIDIAYDTPAGEHRRETVTGFTAVIFQHEIDHLNGILYLDHLAEEQREQERRLKGGD